jgi:hypothetical protein
MFAVDLPDRHDAILPDKSGWCRHHNAVPYLLHRFKVDAVLGRIGQASAASY